MDGRVVQTFNRFYKVKNDEGEWLCSLKGNFRKAPVAYRLPVIGDLVEFNLGEDQDGVKGFIKKIQPRKNSLSRFGGDFRKPKVMAANLDLILVVTGMVKPGIDWGLIDRYMMACEHEEIPVELVFNKIELDPDEGESIPIELYEDLEIPYHLTSAKSGEGLAHLEKSLEGKIVLLTGASGVGKSSLVNALAPHADLKTGHVDAKLGQGRHTTTFSILIPMECGGYLADSPGLRDFVPPMVKPDTVRFGFRDIAAVQHACRFPNCLHDREPGCAVKAAVEEDEIALSRYQHYMELLDEMREWEAKFFS